MSELSSSTHTPSLTASFQDPAGSLFGYQGRVLRVANRVGFAAGLTRGREELHRDLTAGLFESLCRRHFDIVRIQHEEGATRWLYLLPKR